eukprot:350735-Chlamydomonas_euryale.AAC.1
MHTHAHADPSSACTRSCIPAIHAHPCACGPHVCLRARARTCMSASPSSELMLGSMLGSANAAHDWCTYATDSSASAPHASALGGPCSGGLSCCSGRGGFA